jgi:hypothetical protein
MLDSILPTRYRVSKGFVIDADCRRSEQIDLLIYDRRFSPVLLNVGDHLFVPSEAVFGAFEVKQEMNRGTIEYAADKIASVRSLRRTSVPIPYAGGEYKPKPLHHIIGGLLTMGTSWKPPLGDSFKQALVDFGGDGRLDIGCALRSGSFEFGEHDTDLERSDGETALIFFVMRLLKRLQRMASPPAIEYDIYASVLESTRD